MRRRRPSVALVLLIGMASTAVRSGASPQDASPGNDTVIRSTVREVLMDMVVRDAHGHLVTQLEPGDVAVYEDGIRQNMRSFRLISGSEVRVEDEKQAAEAQAAVSNAAGSSAARPPFSPLRTVNVVCLILNDLNPETRGFAFEAARKFVNEELRPNTFIGVFSLDSSGLNPVFPFSNNREHLLKAVELAAINQLPSLNMSSAAMLNGLSMSATGSLVPMAGAVGFADGASVQDPLGLRGDMGFSTNAGLREIDALIGLVRQLGPLPFHKTVLLLSTGLTRPADQLEYWDSLIHRATNGGVTFYAMDVYGLGVCQGDTNPDCVAHSALATTSAMVGYVAGLSAQQGPATLGHNTAGGSQQPVISQSTSVGAAAAAAAAANAQAAASSTSATAQMMELAHQDDYLKFMVSSADRQEAIRELAERTGGFLIANTNNTDKLLAHVMEEVDTHYEITYAPRSEREDGRFRKIEVKLARPDLRVETRSGYYAVPETGAGPVTAAEMAGLRALDTQPRPRAFEFLLRAYRFREAGGRTQYAIAFEMPIFHLTAAPAEDQAKRRLHATLLALVKNERGEIVDRVSKDVSSDVASDHLAAVQAELMTYEHAVNLPPGRYTVEAAVVDQEGGRASTDELQIENREQPGIGISDIALVRQVTNLDRTADPGDPFELNGRRVLPLVGTDLVPGTRPSFYFVVYPPPGSVARPQVRVEVVKDGRTFSKSTQALPAPDASGAIPMVIAVHGDPGNYELKVTAEQAGVSSERTLAYAIAGSVTVPSPAAEISKPGPAKEGTPAAEDAGTAGDERLASFKVKVRRDVAGVPNYTCLETIERSRRTPPLDFQTLDTIRLEVSSVAGKEMFARPGAHSFENQDVTALVTNGLIGSGMFASLARNLFVEDKGTPRYKGKENLGGHAALRYNFRLAPAESGFKVQANNRWEPLAFTGSFWFDDVSFDLVRVEAFGDRLPVELNVDQAVIRTSYARVHIGNSDALLPKRSELTVTYLSGMTNRNVIEFSSCREYASDSRISFSEAKQPAQPQGQPQK